MTLTTEKNWHKLDIPEGEIGEYQISHRITPPGTVLQTGTLRTSFFGQPTESIEFPYEARWHYLSYDGGVWMSDTPVEQIQHDREMKFLDGDVIVGGLGLGYCLTVLRDDPHVKSVRVVEKSKEVIDLVWPHLDLPSDKFEIVHADLFDFLKSYDGPTVDSCFYDIWQSDSENTFWTKVVPLRELTAAKSVCDDDCVICWNEDVMRGQLTYNLGSKLAWVHRAINDEHTISPYIADKMPTIDELATKEDSIWWDWAVPFWKYVQNGEIGVDVAHQWIASYTRLVGTPNWEEGWDEFVDMGGPED